MFDDQLIQIKNKLYSNSKFYPSEELKIIYVARRLTSTTLTLINPRLDKDNDYAYQDIAKLYSHLKELYSDPNKSNNARRKLQDLFIRTRQTFQEFYVVFLRLVTKSGKNQQDLKYELNKKLYAKLQEAVVVYYNDSSITTTTFAQYYTTVD